LNPFLADDLLDVPDVTVTIMRSTGTPPPAPALQHVSSSVNVCPLSVLCLSEPARVEVRTVEDALELAIPAHAHENNRRLFLLARALLCVERERGAKLTVLELKEVFDRWYARAAALKLLRAEETRDMYFKKFMSARRYAKQPLGPTLDLMRLLEKVDAETLPPEAALFDDGKAQRLVGLCRALQEEAGKEPFFLSCRKAAFVLNVEDHHTTADWLFCMVGGGILNEVSKGKGWRASRYIYCPQ